MYVYCFTKFAGYDRVFYLDSKYLPTKLQIGDLLILGNDFFLFLGDNIAFAELYKYTFTPTEKFKIKYKSFVNLKTIELINFLVYQYYTSYSKIINLFMENEISGLLKLLPKKNLGKKNAQKGFQELYIFPDLWSLLNSEIIITNQDKNSIILSSKNTLLQQNKAYVNIKIGKINKIFCTYSQIYQDRNFLQKIYLIDSYKWYYKNQKDPRYWTPTVVNKIGELWDIKIVNLDKVTNNILF